MVGVIFMPAKKTQEQFIEEANNVHHGRYDYSLVNYINSKTKVRIICRIHGEFTQEPTSHISGRGCAQCSGNVRMSTDAFTLKAVQVHGNEYDYSKVNYVDSQVKVEIICDTHGSFWQAPSMHLSGKGCAACKNNLKYTTESFIEKANSIHNNTYDYSLVDYKCSQTKVRIICKEHGEFSVTPNSHLRGVKCAKCKNVARSALSEVIAKAEAVHGDKYDYSLVDYINSKIPVKIICKTHGVFKQNINSHLSGNGCRKCRKHTNAGGGWTRTRLKELVKRSGKGIVYVIRLFNENESFIKVGITTRELKCRLYHFPYYIEVLHEEVHQDGAFIFDLEKYLLKSLKKYRYEPLIPFSGRTECFSNINLSDVKVEIEKFKLLKGL